ncbi:WD repeat-containing protein 20 isoform X2 [Lingula anatina]|uniref:WD repeat-containing protein 20 isoform X2 n=1 Tax=Lingula anatina TaxID=7574 RepID=A0A1S3JFX9_LINAN|nr:WD repeat-containing protein 20 isoform X2 [Lingula anatina]|eukprot:XP_013409051.1 WD repeat-containing protein 20 isoform X2 [Lingula anatina]
MAAQSEGGGRDEVKTQFVTREGTYKLMPLSEYSRPNRVAYNGQVNTPVKTSFINLNDQSGIGDKICFNHGRELYVYTYKGIRKSICNYDYQGTQDMAADLTKPIDKRVYKGTFPTCHDFNMFTASGEGVLLLVGFTMGQVQLIDPIRKDGAKLYNEERLVDKSKVTCIKWIPGSPNQFLVAHQSGQMYVYKDELPCGTTTPHYQVFKPGDGFSVHTCKTKSTRNPLYRWIVGEGAINAFAFSPCAKYLAVVGQDGYLRVFNYDSMELVGTMKSYFGGLLCVCWSPDGKYIVTGGEDDLVTVWSFIDHRVVCRGRGHKSWVNDVAFDPHTSSTEHDSFDFSGSDEDFMQHVAKSNHSILRETLRDSLRSSASKGSNRNSTDSRSIQNNLISYRFGSVGQDTYLCLWDLTEDILRQPIGRNRSGTHMSQNASSNAINPHANKANSVGSAYLTTNSLPNTPLMDGNIHPSATTNLTQKFATLTLGDRKDKETHHDKKEHKRNFSLAGRSVDKVGLLKANHVRPVDESVKLLGTPACPRLDEVPLLEPLVCKKVAHERLTSVGFREECLVTACQEGCVYTWARPGKVMQASDSLNQENEPDS